MKLIVSNPSPHGDEKTGHQEKPTRAAGQDLDVNAFLICDSVVRDAQSGKTSIQGVFDMIYAAAFPAAHPTLAVYFRLSFDEPQSQPVVVGLALSTPSGERREDPAAMRASTGSSGVLEAWINIPNFSFPEAGRYCFELAVNGATVADYVVDAQLRAS
jgi:hypothetical protein